MYILVIMMLLNLLLHTGTKNVRTTLMEETVVEQILAEHIFAEFIFAILSQIFF